MNCNDPYITEKIIALATARGSTKTICPSEVARKLWPDNWRKHMPEVRACAYTLRDTGKVRIMQKGADITAGNIKGPIRVQII